jgi:hypothetical protein
VHGRSVCRCTVCAQKNILSFALPQEIYSITYLLLTQHNTITCLILGTTIVHNIQVTVFANINNYLVIVKEFLERGSTTYSTLSCLWWVINRKGHYYLFAGNTDLIKKQNLKVTVTTTHNDATTPRHSISISFMIKQEHYII